LLLSVYSVQTRFLFHPQKLSQNYTFSYNAEEVFIPVKDATLNGLYFSSSNKPKGLVLYFHGNLGSLKRWGAKCSDFTQYNYDCFMIDYRGYGKSTGEPINQTQWYQDTEAVYNFAKQKSPNLPLLVYGRSLGTSSASYLAGKYQFDKVIIESGPYSFVRIAQNVMPIAPMGLLFTFPFHNHKHLANTTSPTLIIHGAQDATIGYDHFIDLQQKLSKNPNIQFLGLPQGTHHNLHTISEYKNTLQEFLQ